MHVKSHTHHAVLSLLAMTVVQGVGVWADGDFPASRDPLQWPYASESIWNMPIGSNAEYVPQPIDPDHTRGIHVDAVVTIMRPEAKLMDVYGTKYAWQDGTNPTTRCEKWSNTVHLRLPIPTSYVTVFSSSQANNPGAVLLPDGRTLKHPYCFQVCAGGYATGGLRRPGGEIIDELYNAPESDIYGDGLVGTGGGSGLNGLGGTIRLGELSPGSPPIRHALKISFPCEYYLYYDENTGKGYRWPAEKDDSGAATRYNGSEPEAQIGCLRALPPDVDIDALGLETEPGRKIAWTLLNYGAYQVEQVPWSRMMIVVEEGPDGYVAADFEKDYGYSMTTTDKNNPWFKDMMKLYPHLCIVANNAPGSIGGGGTPLSPLAPPFGDGTVENSPPTVRFTKPGESDVFTEPADLGVVVEAGDDDGSVDKVQLFIDDVFIHEEGSAPWEWGTAHPDRGDSLLEELAAGTYTLKAVAVDDRGATTTVSTTVTVERGAVKGVWGANPKGLILTRPPHTVQFFDLTGKRLSAGSFGPGTALDRTSAGGYSGMVIRRISVGHARVKREMIIR